MYVSSRSDVRFRGVYARSPSVNSSSSFFQTFSDALTVFLVADTHSAHSRVIVQGSSHSRSAPKVVLTLLRQDERKEGSGSSSLGSER
jgi:hypothetical protein